VEEKRGKGQPRSFLTEDDFKQAFDDYLDYCMNYKPNPKMPNIAGFCRYKWITRETFYKQDEYYSDTFKKIQNVLEDEAINSNNTTMGIFYLKNKFGFKDKQEIEQVNVNVESELTEEEADAILKKYDIRR